MYKFLILTFLMVAGTATCFSQYITDYNRMGDAAFARSAWYEAASYYLKAATGHTGKGNQVLPYMAKLYTRSKKIYNQPVEVKLADSYRLYGDYTDAEHWYKLAMLHKPAPDFQSTYWYAVSLRANKKYAEAIIAFNSFLTLHIAGDSWSKNALSELNDCQFALQSTSMPEPFNVLRMKTPINTRGGANYAAITGNADTLYFTSSRALSDAVLKQQKIAAGSNLAVSSSPFQSQIYSTTGPVDSYGPVTRMNLPLSLTQQGATAFSPNKKLMLFNAWTSAGDRSEGAVMYTSHQTASGWSTPVPLGIQVNIPGYTAIQPNISTDGKYLFFSSNRPGGLGGYDIWYCRLDRAMNPGIAVNAGPQVNSARDDKSPWYNSVRKQLTFSTNGRTGMGGMDLFRSAGEPGNMEEAVNLKFPINSAKDDLYYAETDTSGNNFYLSSDRESTCCLEIFYLSRRFSQLSGIVNSCGDNSPLAGVKVQLINDSTRVVSDEIITGADGEYSFRVKAKMYCSLLFAKVNYFSKRLVYPADSTWNTVNLYSKTCLQHFDMKKPIALKNILYDFDLATLRPASEIVLDTLYETLKENPDISILLSSHTDNKGTDLYNLRLSANRARSCVVYLIEKGIDPGRLSSIGYGKRRPIAPNNFPDGSDDPDGRQLNRRTEFEVIRTGFIAARTGSADRHD